MEINRDRHNQFIARPYYSGEQPTTESEKTGSGSTTIIIGGGGGSGLTDEQYQKLAGIEEGAQVNQDAFSYIQLSDGTNVTEIQAITPTDKANIQFEGVGVDVTVVPADKIDLTNVTSTGPNTGTYSFAYGKHNITTPPTTEGGEPIVTVKELLEIKYVSGQRIQASEFTNVWLLDSGGLVGNWSPIASWGSMTTNAGAQLETITLELDNTYFRRVQFINRVTTEGKVEDIVVCNFNIAVARTPTVTITSHTDFWKLDEKGNLYTTYNTYSTKELSAYGLGPGEEPTGGAQYLHELKDVDTANLKNAGILQYNSSTSKWEVTDGSSIRPDLTGYATQAWVNTTLGTYATKAYVDTKVAGIVNSAPETLDTLKELADALGNDPNFATTVLTKIGVNTTNIQSNAKEITDLKSWVAAFQNMFEWDKSASASDSSKWIIKAKASLYSVAEVSAYGYQSSDAPFGAQYLHELKDVTLTSLSSGQLLQWNGTRWVNIDKDAVGLNESELAAYLTTNNYAKKDYVTWNNLTGKPTWIGTTKPSYSYSEITGTPTVQWDNVLGRPAWINVSSKPSYTFAEIGNTPTTLSGYGITDAYTKIQTDNLLSAKANKATTLAGYGITDAYTKTATDSLLSTKADKATTLAGYGITDGVNAVSKSGTGNALTSLSVSGHTLTYTMDTTFLVKSLFDDLFEKVNVGTAAAPVYAIKAKYHLYSVGEVTAWASDSVSLPSIWDSLPIDTETLGWVNGLLTVIGGVGNAGSIKVNGTTYYPNDDGLITLPNYPTFDGSGYVTLTTLQTISGIKSFTNQIKLTKTNFALNQEGLEYYNGSTRYGVIGAVHNGSTIYWMQINPKGGILDGHNGLVVGDELGFNGHQVYHSGNITIPTVPDGILTKTNYAGILDSRYYTEAESNARFVTLNTTQTITNTKTFTAEQLFNARSIYFQNNTVGGSANGLYLRKSGWGVVKAGIGFYTATDGDPSMYIGWGESPWLGEQNFHVSSSVIQYKGNNILHQGNYTSYLDSRYVNTTGDTMSGPLTISASGDIKIILQSTDADNYSLISAQNSSGTQLSYLGYAGEAWRIDGGNILTSKNYAPWLDGRYYTESEADSRFVNVSGDTMSGNLNFTNNQFIYFNDNTDFAIGSNGSIGTYLQYSSNVLNVTSQDVYFNGNQVWHAGNDGLSSALEAGKSGKLHIWDVREVDRLPNYFDDKTLTAFFNYAGMPTTDWWSGIVVSGWTNPGYVQWQLAGYSSAGAAGEHSLCYREGKGSTWQPWKALAFTTDNVASATKLQTARTLWGQSFDGTGNVSGDMSSVGTILSSANNTKRIGSASNQWEGVYAGWVSGGDGRDLILAANNANKVWILTNGNVGIGLSPSSNYKLHVNGNIRANGFLSCGEDTDDKYGYVNVTRPNAANNYCCYAFVKAGVNAYGMGYTGDGLLWLGHPNTSRVASSYFFRANVNSAWFGDEANILIYTVASNPYISIKQSSSTYLIQGYNNYLYLGITAAKSLRIDSNGYTYTPSGIEGSDVYARNWLRTNCPNDDTSSMQQILFTSGDTYVRKASLQRVIHTVAATTRTLDLRSYNSNTWYPCWINGTSSYGFRKLKIQVTLSGNKPSWATHDSGFTLIADMTILGSGWGVTNYNGAWLDNIDMTHGGETAFGGYEQNHMASDHIIWLRGGAVYYYYTDLPGTLTSSTSGYSWKSGNYSYSAAPRTTQGNYWDGFNMYRFFSTRSKQTIELHGQNNDALIYHVPQNHVGYYSGASEGNYIIARENNGPVTIVKVNSSGLNLTGNLVATGEVTAFSDARLKSNITNLSFRGKLRPRTYIKDNKQQIGFIAQEVQELYPELVLQGTDENHYLSLNYGNITAVLSAQINVIDDEVSLLKKRVKELEDKIKEYDNNN